MTDSSHLHREILAHIDRLPSMPQTVAEVMRMGRSGDFSPTDLAEVVCRDPTLATRVLKLCNSGFYALSQPVASIHRAVLLLGFETVKNLVFSTFVHAVVQGDVEGYAQSSASLWEHSFGVATASVVLAETAAPDLAEAAYTAGLIHDIGKVVLASFLTERFEEVVARVRAAGGAFDPVERQVLGTTHGEVGALVAERWHLAPVLCEVIRHHHHPHRMAAAPKLGALVSLGDAVCDILGIGTGLDGADRTFDPWCLETLGLEGGAFQRVLDDVTDKLLDLKGSGTFEPL
ncbi:MAG: HDOD domain-containing protein [Deferrisomatales bacterium]